MTIAKIINSPSLYTQKTILIPNSDIFAFGTGDFSVAIWFYARQQGSVYYLFSKWPSYTEKLIAIMNTGSNSATAQKISVYLTDASATSNIALTSTASFAANTWNCAMINFNRASTIDIYLNSATVKNSTDMTAFSAINFTNTANATLAYQNGKCHYADLAIKKSVMTLEQRQAFLAHSFDNTLLGFDERFHFEENTGDKIYGQGGSVGTIQVPVGNEWSIKQNLKASSLKIGYDKWLNNSTSAQLDVALAFDGITSVKGAGDTITGFSHKSKNSFINGGHNLCAATQFDFTDSGVNADVPVEMATYNPNSLTGLEDTQLFTKKHYDNAEPPNLIGVSKISIYSEEIEDKYKAQTQIYLDNEA
jgi:hypothetical protein